MTPDAEFGISYQIKILKLMVDQLPSEIKEPILQQIDEVIKAIAEEHRSLISAIEPKLADLRLDITYLEFDRQAIQKERNNLAKRLKDITGE